MNDLHGLISRMADELDYYRQLLTDDRREVHALAVEARAALAAEADGPASVVGEPSDEELLDIAAESVEPYPENICAIEVYSCELIAFARAVLARYGHQPTPPAEGEVGDEAMYLAKELRDQADDMSPALELFGLMHRAADLLEQRHPTPVPVAERLPGPEDCDAEGNIWAWRRFDPEGDMDNGDFWCLAFCKWLEDEDCGYTHWLPANALPLPQGEVVK